MKRRREESSEQDQPDRKRKKVEATDEVLEVKGYKNIFEAAKDGNLAAIEFFIGNGVDINAFDNIGNTPLVVAAFYGHMETVQWLFMQEGVMQVTKDSALMQAARSGHIEIVQWLVGHGADSDCVLSDGSTPLILAASNGHMETVQWLFMQEGVTQEDKNIVTRFVVEQGHMETVKWLFTQVLG